MRLLYLCVFQCDINKQEEGEIIKASVQGLSEREHRKQH